MASNTNVTLTNLQRNYTIFNARDITFDLVDRANCTADAAPAELGLAVSGGSLTATTNGFFNGMSSVTQVSFDMVLLAVGSIRFILLIKLNSAE